MNLACQAGQVHTGYPGVRFGKTVTSISFSDQSTVAFSAFRADPDAHPLRTPSGKIDIFSDAIDSFGYDVPWPCKMV
jgi:biotin/methionine sulfoxide reductase